MKKKTLSLILITMIVFSLSACKNEGKPLETSISRGTATEDQTEKVKNETNTNKDYEDFLGILSENEIQYTESEIDNDSFLSVPRKPILIGDEIISVYVYESNKDMEQDSKYIGKDGCSIFRPGNSVEISWVSFPHFFKKDTLIINYIGANEKIINFLNENYGAEFAGSEYEDK